MMGWSLSGLIRETTARKKSTFAFVYLFFKSISRYEFTHSKQTNLHSLLLLITITYLPFTKKLRRNLC